jgi:Zn-dependent metalloprotease
MNKQKFDRFPICCIIPPYVLDAIARNGTQKQRAAALQSKAADTPFRAHRLATQSLRFAPSRNVLPTPMATLPKRTIYTENTQNPPGTVVRIEDQDKTGDPAVDEAYDGLGATITFFEKVFGRNSIDDNGMPLDATVHFGDGYNNAFWNSVQMVFGDGDGEIFNRLTLALEVIGHELAHGSDRRRSQYPSCL